MTAGVRPRVGELRRLGGTVVPLRFVETDRPGVFRAVTLDGCLPGPQPGGQIVVDVVGPGQSVEFLMPEGQR